MDEKELKGKVRGKGDGRMEELGRGGFLQHCWLPKCWFLSCLPRSNCEVLLVIPGCWMADAG